MAAASVAAFIVVALTYWSRYATKTNGQKHHSMTTEAPRAAICTFDSVPGKNVYHIMIDVANAYQLTHNICKIIFSTVLLYGLYSIYALEPQDSKI